MRIILYSKHLLIGAEDARERKKINESVRKTGIARKRSKSTLAEAGTPIVEYRGFPVSKCDVLQILW